MHCIATTILPYSIHHKIEEATRTTQYAASTVSSRFSVEKMDAEREWRSEISTLDVIILVLLSAFS